MYFCFASMFLIFRYLVLAPEHHLLASLVSEPQRKIVCFSYYQNVFLIGYLVAIVQSPHFQRNETKIAGTRIL